MTTLRVVVADDHKIVRRGTCAMLAEASDIEVVGEASNGEEALRAIAEHRPDVAVLDLSMPLLDGIGVIAKLKEQRAPVRTLILSAHTEPDFMLRAIRTGADGYLLKTAEEDQLQQAVRLVASGHTALLQPEVTQVVMGAMRGAAAIEPPTDREIEILREVAKDLGNKQIATRLGISDRTVQQHLSNIFAKLGVSSRTGAALRALQEGWISLDDARV